MRFFRGRKQKIVAVFLAITILNSVVYPTAALALTGGPSQPEVNSFSPIGTSDMVDLFTGDFKYNIPLLDVGGYPLNIAYSPGSGPDTEASFVGLGWNINPGVIGRTVRGLPDDFKGDQVRKEYNIKGQHSFGVNFAPDLEIFAVGGKEVKGTASKAKDAVTNTPIPDPTPGEEFSDGGFDYSLSAGVSYNNYNGVGFEFGFNPSFSMAKYAKNEHTEQLGSGGETPVPLTEDPTLLSQGSVGANIGVSSSSGVSVSPSASFSKRVNEKDKEGIYNMKGGSIGLSMNSRQGFTTLTMKRVNDTYKSERLKVDNHISHKDTRTGSKSIGGALTFNTPTYTPKQDMPMVNVSASVDLNLGPELFGGQGELGTSGYYSGQFLSVKDKSSKAYGYMYSEKASKFGLHDFNRENEGGYSKNTPNLPVTNYTYDIFSVSGQGLGGTFRPFRNDVGVLHDQRQGGLGRAADDKGSTDVSVSAGIEVGMGQLTKWGVNVNSTVVNTNSGDWNLFNSLANQIDFRSGVRNTDEETYYFKQAGELHVDKEAGIFNKIGGFNPVEPVVNTLLMAGSAPGEVSDEKGNVYKLFHSDVKRKTRRNRNQVMKISTADEAQFNALNKVIQSYNENSHVLDALGQYIVGLEDPRYDKLDEKIKKKHHISQIVVSRPDGVSYVYGIPAYNTVKKEVTMAVDREGDCSTGLVTYLPDDENTKDNGAASDHFFDRQTTPAYAHSFLLTAVVSPDYVDLKGDGPSDDDLGTYTKFNYSKKYEDYKWRVPFGLNQANYSEGLKTKNTNDKGSVASDNKGSYSYGKKEVWYMHSIVTKNYIAEFNLSDRKDGYEVASEDGGFGTRSLQKLDRIDLFSKADKLELGENATPLKSVHFKYDYSLCKGVPNNIDNENGGPIGSNDGGKLTLKQLYFTYEHSNKAILNSYRFNYSSFNPSYDVKSYDRWGNFKPENSTGCDVTSPLSNSEFPYAEQSKSLADKYAEAWNLKTVDLPSGGRIKVTYESDDYAYVQDKRSMQMFKVLGAGDSKSPVINSVGKSYELGSNALSEAFSLSNLLPKPKEYLYFKLKEPIGAINPSEANKIVQSRYGKGIKDMYFRFLLDLNNKGGYEYVSGYADPKEMGVVTTTTNGKDANGNYLFGYVELKTVKLENRSIASSGFLSGDNNPIRKAGWNFTRKNLPRMAYGQPNIDANEFLQFVQAIGSSLRQIRQFITGFNRELKQNNFSKNFVTGKSWIRLHEPTGFKMGGGSRVKKIEMSDEWEKLSGVEDTYEYGQEYNYTTEETFAGETKIISSGAAAYEPQAGSDENPFKKPIYFGKDNLLAPDDDNFHEEPLGEIFFPGASVGYRKVTVKDLTRYSDTDINENGKLDDVVVTKNATGKVVHQFYTAKEYPTIVKRTNPNPRQNLAGKIFSFLKLNNWDHLAVSQGFVVELNDMHGKQRKQEVFPEGSEIAISSVEYYYKSGAYDINASDDQLIASNTIQYNADGTVKANSKALSEKRRLANKADVIYKYAKDGKPIKKALIGVDYDFVADMVRSETITVGGGVDFNADAFMITFVPAIIPIPLPKLNFEHTGYYQATMTKVINRYSLLDKTVARDLGSEVTTENLLYDAETGEVLLTKTINEFDDPVYNFTYPAHWSYDRMGMAFENTGLKLYKKELSDIGSLTRLFHKTDELLLVDPTNDANNKIVWVTSTGGGTVHVVDRDGNTDFSGKWNITINRSGKKNMQSTPVGSITTLTDPRIDMNNDGQFDRLSFDNVLNAGMTEFTDEWRVDCNCGLNPSESNAFLKGAIGSWRPLKSWVYLTDRTKSQRNNNTNTRLDGVFEHYNDFWLPTTTSTEDWKPDINKEEKGWQYTTEVSFFNMHGLELENHDALNRFSSALYGHYFSLPKAVSNNAMVNEVAFDSFEDYLPTDCDDDHFSYRMDKEKVTSEESHSGKRSLKLGAGEEVKVRKVIKECQNIKNGQNAED